jgi:thiol-disulfide isomerase/thioredoxin
MKRRSIWFCALFVLLIASPNTPALSNGQDLNAPPKPTARELVKRAVILAEADKPQGAVASLRRALSISPHYLRAHIEYINIKTNFLGRYDEVQQEYEVLLQRHPRNAVYLMALNYRSNGLVGRDALKRVVELAPAWAWGHYAQALLLKETDPEKAVIELERCIAADGSAKEAYDLLIELQENRLHRIDGAIRTAERLAAQKEIRPTLRLSQLWRLRLVKANYSDESRRVLRVELSELASRTNEVGMLEAIRSAYLNLLNDSVGAELVAARIRRLDRTWMPERGWIFTQIHVNQSGVPRYVILVNRQIAINKQAQRVVGAIDIVPAEKIRQLQELLSAKPSPEMRRIIYEKIFQVAVRSRDAATVMRYGTILRGLDPDDSVLMSETARVLADNRSRFARALYLASEAEKRTSRFHSPRRPANTPQALLNEIFPETKQRAQHELNRAAILDTLGWVLVQLNRARDAEPLLRQAVKIAETEERLTHWATALQKLNRIEDASVVRDRVQSFLAESIKKKLIKEQIDNLAIKSIQGETFNLADLRGRPVLITFWASWCVPCRLEIPHLKTLFEKFKGKGLQIVAISIDEEAANARALVSDSKLPYFVSIDPTLGKKFTEQGIPLSLFIDKTGLLRYRKLGYEEGDEREVEFVITELLK